MTKYLIGTKIVLGGGQMNIKIKIKTKLRIVGNNQTGIAINPDILKEANLKRGDFAYLTLTETGQLIIEKAKENLK